MKPIDYRNASWEQIRDLVDGQRHLVYEAWLRHGPGTTRAVAARAGIDLLSFRPRSTELYQLGLLELAGPEHQTASGKAHEGVYFAVAEARAMRAFLEKQREARTGQLNLL
ncbi:MAG: hypothetical protein LBD30_07340 [Verrucomicrobiales bacterium]|jgi:hypothetical protein|nr:hypothetical protein [Verrucomicrobiales bacterium]